MTSTIHLIFSLLADIILQSHFDEITIQGNIEITFHYIVSMFLILFFTVVVYILAFYLLFLKEKEEKLEIKMGLLAKGLSGIISGFISAPMGIGGAVMNVPILKFFGFIYNSAAFELHEYFVKILRK